MPTVDRRAERFFLRHRLTLTPSATQALWSIAAYVLNSGGGNDGLHVPLAGWCATALPCTFCFAMVANGHVGKPS